jgi:hypothetical protein
MHLDDRPQFDTAFARLAQTFRLRLKPVEREELATIYFKLLQGWSLEEVLAAAKACLTSSRTFPKPADWLAALPPKATLTADLRWMGAEEAAEYLRAEALHYEDAACECLLCRAANVTDKPLRFVPDFNSDLDREERAFHPGKNQVVTVGHWAHGESLARWYAAREAFFARSRRLPMLRAMPRVLALIGAREPGEDDV